MLSGGATINNQHIELEPRLQVPAQVGIFSLNVKGRNRL